MKTLRSILLSLLFLYVHCANAQDIPPPNPTLSLNIVAGYTILFTFDEIAEYKDGIMNTGQSTFIRIGSIYDWKLQFNADQSIFYGENDGSNQMELNNVGLTVISTGTNLDDGSNIINYAITLPLALQSDPITVLTKGSGSNRGWGIQNAFTMNWEMGTKRGNMNNQSMLEQMLKPDTYNVNIILTLSVYP